MAKRTNPNFMNGVPELLILQLLVQREMYGYELVKAIRQSTDDLISLGEGVVYPVLHGLERNGCIKSRTAKVNGRTRHYYSVTTQGQERLGTISQEWSSITQAIRKVVGEGPNALPAT